MLQNHKTEEIAPGLVLSLFNASFSEPFSIEMEHEPCIVLSVVIDGSVTFNSPVRAHAHSRNVICCSSDRQMTVCSQIAACSCFRSVDLCITPEWFRCGSPALSCDCAFACLRRAANAPPETRVHPRPPRFQPLLGSLVDNMHDEGALSKLRRKSVSYELLCWLAELYDDPERLEAEALRENCLARVQRQITSCPGEIKSIDALARKNGLSASKLKRDYQLSYGISVGTAVRNARLETAHRLIEKGQAISLASYETGYSHASSFSAAFRKYFGYSPRDLKRRHALASRPQVAMHPA